MEPLTSQRYAPLNHHHPRPKPYDMLHGVVLFEQPPVKPMTQIPERPFRLLDLPVEIQRLVYEHYFGGWEVTLDFERVTMFKSRFRVEGVPLIDLLLTCRAVYAEAKDLRLRTFTGTLNLNNVFILVTLWKKEKFDWLRQNVRTLHFSDASIHPERWNRYYDNFPNLQKLEIEFPHVIGLDARCRVLDDVLQGKCDDVLLESLDHFRLTLVDQLSGLLRVMVTQRYCLKETAAGWKGILDIKIQLSQEGTRIVRRHREDGVTVVSKRQFRRPL